MRAVLPLLGSLAMALSAFGLALAAPGRERGELTGARVAAAAGAVEIVNSHEGTAVLGAAALQPGEQVSGTVTIGNAGTLPGILALRPGALTDTPGWGGGRLSDALQLSIFDVTDAARPVTLYAGPAVGLPELAAGTVAAGAAREYRLEATLVTPPGDDNRFQGSALSLGLEWGATAVLLPAPPTPAPVLPPPAPAPAPPAAPTPAPALADLLGLPRAGTCARGGRLRFKLRAPHGGRVVSATVTVNRKTQAKGRKALATITLRKLPKRTTVAVTVKASDRKTYKASRTYSACTR
jgi:spore coat-associated protein N